MSKVVPTLRDVTVAGVTGYLSWAAARKAVAGDTWSFLGHTADAATLGWVAAVLGFVSLMCVATVVVGARKALANRR